MLAPTSIVVEDLSFRYQGRRRPAFEHLSFTVESGETLLVLGPSGCGKSTLMLCLNGLIPHSVPGDLAGRVIVAGDDVRETPVATLARTVGLVFQDPDAQFCMLRVDDEIAFGLENLLVPRSAMDARIDRALKFVGLADARRTRIDRLSGGGRQRLALACVLAMEPSILIFDEPTSNLDPAGSEEVFAAVARLRSDRRRTIVIVEHRLDHLVHLVDRVLVLSPGGQKLAIGPPHATLADHAHELDEYGIWIPQVSELANRVARQGVAINPYPLTIDEAVTAFEPLIRDGRTARVRFDQPRTRDDSVEPAVTEENHECEIRVSLPQPSPRPARGETAPAIELARLTYRYPAGNLALDDISLSVPEGSFLAIAGPNGAGKSTLAAHLIGSIRPPPDRVKLFGRDVRGIAATDLPRFVGYVFQNPEHQFVAGTVYDELAFGPRLGGLAEEPIRERVEAMLEDFGLAALARANPFTLSHGEKRRLSVATMLMLGQRLLVLDEPTFGQDRTNTIALMDKLAALNREGRTIVMITHDVRLIAEYAERVAVMIDGSIAFAGSVDRLFDDPDLLDRAHLLVPPVLELGRRLMRVAGPFPATATTRQFVEELERRQALSQRDDSADLPNDLLTATSNGALSPPRRRGPRAVPAAREVGS